MQKFLKSKPSRHTIIITLLIPLVFDIYRLLFSIFRYLKRKDTMGVTLKKSVRGGYRGKVRFWKHVVTLTTRLSHSNLFSCYLSLTCFSLFKWFLQPVNGIKVPENHRECGSVYIVYFENSSPILNWKVKWLLASTL